MGINAINNINPFQKPFGTNVYGKVNFHPAEQNNIFAQNNKQGSSKGIGSDLSIFNSNFDVKSVSGLNPFASINKTTTGISGVSPIHARENYRNGLAPSDNLQNVYAGNYNGKPNFLNQIAIA